MAKKIEPPFVRNPYNYDVREASLASALHCKDPSRTQQQFTEESDINYIANRYGLTGELPQVLNLPSYGNFEGIFDFQTAQNAIVQANNQFMTLPAKLRARFNNSPQQLLEFLENPDNRAEAEFLGLVKKPQDPPRSTKGAPAPTTEGAIPTPDDKAPEAAPSTPKTAT